MRLQVRELSKHYPGVSALDGVELDVESGELIALLGPSGSGKTTLLRVIAGLLAADRGKVLFGDRDATRLSLRERNVGFVFQHYALFRHMTVAENVAFGLRSRPRARRPGNAAIAARVEELLTLIQLPELGGRYPDQLSGGQKQRVALARALAIDPDVLLLDEPFGALDAKVRADLRRWLRRLHRQTGRTTIFVTHDQEEALELADRVAVLREGRIEQLGAPDRIYREPETAFVYDFIGRSNLLEGRVYGNVFSSDDGAAVFPADGYRDGAAAACIRPHELRPTDGDGIVGRVLEAHRRADRVVVELQVGTQQRLFEWDMHLASETAPPAPGETLRLLPLRPSFYPR